VLIINSFMAQRYAFAAYSPACLRRRKQRPGSGGLCRRRKPGVRLFISRFPSERTGNLYAGLFTGRLGEVSGRLGEVSGRLGEVSERLGEVSGRLGEVCGKLGEVCGKRGNGFESRGMGPDSVSRRE
jgi:hypothetical protein